MQKLITFAALSATLAAPIKAAEWGMTDNRSGSFAGARLRIPLGANSTSKPQASLALAPLTSRRMSDGRMNSRIGEGVTINFAGKKPEINLGEIRADRVVQIVRGRAVDAEGKSGISTGAAIGIGVGLVVAVGVAVLIAKRTCIGEDPDFCGSD